jgi:hypothetical protein
MANGNPLEEVTALLGGGAAIEDQFTSVAQQLRELQATNQAQAEIVRSNTRAVDQNTQSGSSTAEKIGSTVENILGFGLGFSPLITGLASLFGGGGGSEAPPPLVPFVMPLPVNATAGISPSRPGEAFAVDTSEGGIPRAVPSPQITVQVQAMDSRSFLDHSGDIALAVRQAMLESSVLNDVIREV